MNLEALWIFPLYFICPLIGLILVFVGIVKIKNGESKKTLYFGSSVFAIPFVFTLFTTIFHFGLQKNVEGKYSLGNETEILTINNNGKFILKNSTLYLNSGNGTWEIEQIDFPILKLKFDSKNSELWLQINEGDRPITLSTISAGNDIPTNFVKQ